MAKCCCDRVEDDSKGKYLYLQCKIKTHSCVSVAKKDMLHTGVLFTGTSNLPLSTPYISVTAALICTKFIYE